jgi:maltokinase
VIAADELTRALIDYLPKQRWFGGDDDDARQLELASTQVLRSEWPALVQVLVQVPTHGEGIATYHVLLGMRPIDSNDAFLEGKGAAVLGEIATDLGPAVAYDAAVDPELARCVFEKTVPDEHPERARFLGIDQSNTSVVFDERWIMKVFRRVGEGPNPDVEMTSALAAAGFAAVASPVGEWREGSTHLAVVSEFLAGGTDGFQLALTSLRDLYDGKTSPADAGGDFGPDAYRLGAITAEMHVAAAEAFGSSEPEVGSWLRDMEAQLGRTSHRGVDVDAVRAVESTLTDIDTGQAIRIHGDYHLGQVMRTDSGWYILDFEGEPARPIQERRRPSSPLRDVAGMVRSFHYAAAVAQREHGDDDDVGHEAIAWEAHNRRRFLDGYYSVDAVDALLPRMQRDRDRLLAAFELDKAVYEVAYEASHRPEWVGIPLSAVQRIVEESAHGQRTP